MNTARYPIGIQTFETLREEKCVYADKTAYIYRLVTSASHTFLLSRPRRFGKSLLLSTFDAYFRGRKDLFEGLAIYKLEKEWKSYPVIRFDFSRAEAKSAGDLREFIAEELGKYEKEYGIAETSGINSVGLRFGSLIERISKTTGKKVVILIDEYDKGIHEVMYNEKQLVANQDVLRPFFSQIKAQGEFLRFCFITGVARFRNYTLFSGFNNPNDISMDDSYAGICGITRQELTDCFSEGIGDLAQACGFTTAQTLDMLRLKYDGYRFTDSQESVYNPFSIINCLEKKKMMNFWVKSGAPKVFVDYLTQSPYGVLDLENIWCTQESMESTYSMEDPIPLLFQTGYLTIKDTEGGLYRLGIPNGEVRSALVDDLVPRYMGVKRNALPTMMVNLRRALNSGDAESLMTFIQQLVAQIPYHELDVKNIEKTYHLVIYELFLLLGVDTRSEVSMSGGRIDMVVQTHECVYVMEFKLGGTAEDAMAQIDSRGYALPWSADGRRVFKIEAVFSPETRTLSAWKVCG